MEEQEAPQYKPPDQVAPEEDGMDDAEFALIMERQEQESRELDRWVRQEIADSQKRPWWMFGIRTIVY